MIGFAAAGGVGVCEKIEIEIAFLQFAAEDGGFILGVQLF